MTLPYARLVEVPPDLPQFATAPADVCFHIGCSSKGALLTPTPFGGQQIKTAEATFGCGPLPREGGYIQGKVPVQFGFIRVPATARVATKSTPATVRNVSSDFTTTLSGTPTDGADVVLTFTLGGTTGTGPISYTVSTDGGVTTGAPVSLATGLTIVILGVTITLGSGKIVTTGDVVTWWQMPASAAILPSTVTRAGTSTSTMTPSGTPNDGYEVQVIFRSSGTVGTTGITYTVSLDGGRTISPETALGTATTILPLDGLDASGLTITLGAGTIDARDQIVFATTPPVPQWSDVSLALDALRNWSGVWSFVNVCGFMTRAFRDSLETKLQSFATSGRFTWGAVSARDRMTGESTTARDNTSGDLAWSARVVSEWATSAGNRTPWFAGASRVVCPLTGRSSRRPATLGYLPRLIGYSPDTDPGEKDLGSLSSDIAIHDNTVGGTGALLEHDARVNTSLFDIGACVLRTWYGEQGLEPGVYCARGNLGAATGDIQRIAHRRILNLCDAALLVAMTQQVLKKFGRWPASVRPPYRAGDIMEWDRLRMLQALRQAAVDAVGGYVSDGARGISVTVNPTPGFVGGNTVVYQSTKLTWRDYVDAFEGTIGFTNPSLNAISTPAS